MSSGLYVLEGMCPGAKCPGGIYPWGKCLGVHVIGGGGYICKIHAFYQENTCQKVITVGAKAR